MRKDNELFEYVLRTSKLKSSLFRTKIFAFTVSAIITVSIFLITKG